MNNKIPNLKRLKQIAQSQDITSRGVEKWYGPLHRKISLLITWLLLHFKWITPNMITVLDIFIGTFGGFLLLLRDWVGLLLFFLTFQMWGILDSVDGELARASKRKSLSGPYLDLLGHFTIYIGVFVPLGLKVANILQNYNFIIWGLFCSILGISIALPEITQNIILYTKKRKIISTQTEKTKSLLINLYRAIIDPIAISVLGLILLLIKSKMALFYQKNIWLAFFIFYCLLFLISFLLSSYRSKKLLDTIK